MAGKPSSQSSASSTTEWRTDARSVPTAAYDYDELAFAERLATPEPADLRELLAMQTLLMLERASLEQDDL